MEQISPLSQPVPNQRVLQPAVANPTQLLLGISLLVIVLFGLVQIGILLFNQAYAKGKQEGWELLMNSKPLPKGKFLKTNPVVYELEGTIAKVDGRQLTLERDGQYMQFDTGSANYTIVAPYEYFEEFPTKIIEERANNKFSVGDKVLVLANVVEETMDRNTTLKRVIKIQE